MPSALPCTLSVPQIDFFEKNGYLLLDDLLDSDAIRQMQAWTQEVKEWPDKTGEHMPYQEERSDGTIGLCRTENYANYHPGFGRLFRDERLVGVLSTLMGEEAVLFKEKINYKEAGGSGGFDAHIDATAYVHSGAINHLTFLLAVDDMNMQNGCLEVVPGSHHETIPLGGNKVGIRIGICADDQCIERKWEAEHVWVPVPCQAGALLIFGSYLAHRSGPNSSPKPRAAIYATYNGISEGDKHDAYYQHRRKVWPPTSERVAGVDYTEGAITYAFGSPMTGGKSAIEAYNVKSDKAKATTERLLSLLHCQGHRGYIGENISQLEHSLQVADQARRAGADNQTVAAALLHDIGQFLPGDQLEDMVNDAGESVGKRSHDVAGAAYLRGLGFPDKVCRLVGGHVQAKRYLTATRPEYLEKLSNASRASLQCQGGPFDSAQVAAFEADPVHRDIVNLRLWDDLAKLEDHPTSDLNSYRQTLIAVLT